MTRSRGTLEEQFDITPVTEAIQHLGLTERSTAPTIWRLYHRANQRGHCSAITADKLAIGLLGTHPALLWGEAWWDET